MRRTPLTTTQRRQPITDPLKAFRPIPSQYPVIVPVNAVGNQRNRRGVEGTVSVSALP